jgi:hypothetical protein
VPKDIGEAAVDFVGLILGADIQVRARLRQRANPIAAERMGDAELKLQERLAGGTLARKQRDIATWEEITYAPFPRRHTIIDAPCRRVDEGQGVRGR